MVPPGVRRLHPALGLKGRAADALAAVFEALRGLSAQLLPLRGRLHRCPTARLWLACCSVLDAHPGLEGLPGAAVAALLARRRGGRGPRALSLRGRTRSGLLVVVRCGLVLWIVMAFVERGRTP